MITLTYCKMRLFHIAETIRFNGVAYLLHEIVYRNREAILVEKDLSTVQPPEDALRQAGVRIEEITQPVVADHALQFPVRYRFLKAAYYLEKGYRGFALVSGHEVLGDIWCSPPDAANGVAPPDIEWLGIRCKDNYIYTFDMYVNPAKRGGAIAALLQIGALYELKKMGFDRAFGYFWSNNIPALWVHRMLKWSERSRIKMRRFFFIKIAAHQHGGGFPDERGR